MDDKQYKELIFETRLNTAITVAALGIAYIFFATTMVATILNTNTNNILLLALWGGLVLVGLGAALGIWSWMKNKQ